MIESPDIGDGGITTTSKSISCGICGSLPGSPGNKNVKKRFLCNSCSSYSVLGSNISLINVMTEVASLRDDINDLINDGLIYDKIHNPFLCPPSSNHNQNEDNEPEDKKDSKLLSKRITHNWTKLLSAKIRELQSNLENINDSIWNTKESIEFTTAKIAKQKTINDERTTHIEIVQNRLLEHYSEQKNLINNQITKTNIASTNLSARLHSLQTKHVREVCALFGIRKVRRKRDRLLELAAVDQDHSKNDKEASIPADREIKKNITSSDENRHTSNSHPHSHSHTHTSSLSRLNRHIFHMNLPNISFARKYDILIGFNEVPDLSLLAHYHHVTVNSSIERIAFLVNLVAYYMDIRLPYEITFLDNIYPRISPHGKAKLSLSINRTFRKFAQENPREFELYAKASAMLALDLAALAHRKGIHLSSPEDIAQINRTLAIISNIRTESNSSTSDSTTIKEKTSPSPTNINPQNISSTTSEFVPDLPAVHDYIITQMYTDISGGSTEWNLIDKEAILDSVVDLSTENNTAAPPLPSIPDTSSPNTVNSTAVTSSH